MAETKTPASSSTRAKNKYNEKTYEQIHLMVKRGEKERIRKWAESKGESVNGYINRLILKDMHSDE